MLQNVAHCDGISFYLGTDIREACCKIWHNVMVCGLYGNRYWRSILRSVTYCDGMRFIWKQVLEKLIDKCDLL